MTSEILKERNSQFATEQDFKKESKAGSKRESPFRFAEGCLYNYRENLARLEQLKADLEELTSRTVTNYEAEGHSVGTHSDPVLRYVQQMEAIKEEVAGLERRTRPITRLLADLESPYVLDGSPYMEMAKILRLCYFAKNSKDQIAVKLHMDRRRVYEKRDELVRLAIKYLGW